MKLVLFDVDGTLIDSQAIIHESMRQTFLRFGRQEPDISETRSIIGLTLDRAIATILNQDITEEILAMTAEYKSCYLELANRKDMQSLPFAGIPEMIDRLAQRDDLMLGIVTGKSRRGVRKLLEQSQFQGRFVVSRCADDCPSKPHPAMVKECCEEVGMSPFNTIVIGDTGFDMQMAGSAGAKSIGVTWGYHAEQRIVDGGAGYMVRSVPSLENMIFSIAGITGDQEPVAKEPTAQFGDTSPWYMQYA
ncbi:MAG: HAD-IA family hydrolase [Salaquimonas sp.]